MKVVHDWLKDYIGETIPSPEKIEELLNFHAFEVEGIEKVGAHDVIDIKILPDRGSDCLSHRGIARELASITGIPLEHDPFASDERIAVTDNINVRIEDVRACSRFGAALITGIEVKDSPAWLQDRLRAIGQRPINNVVDATNHVMYALGQPLHAYDADLFPQVEGQWNFVVRLAQEGEEVSLIAEGGKKEDRVVTLKGNELLIVDGSNNCPIGLAGVKGGAYAEVHKGTKNIIIEAAHFDAILTRKTARRLGIVIDASKRFENNPSPELIPHALREVVQLITEIAGGKSEGAIDENHTTFKPVKVVLQVAQVNALLGLTLSQETMVDLLKRIGATVVVEKDMLIVTHPFERTDLLIPEDYIEEIGRLHGYQHIISEVPVRVVLQEFNERHFYSEQLRNVLIAEGFSEVITSTFMKQDSIQLQNALASDKSYVRSSLRTNIKEVLDKNANFVDMLGAQDTRVFEIGTVFQKDREGITEYTMLAVGIRTKVSGSATKDQTELEKIVTCIRGALHTDVSFEIQNDGVAECNFTNIYTTLSKPTEYQKVSVAEEITYKPFSPYPAVSRDIALWVTEGTDEAIVEDVLNTHAGELRVRTTLVDVFTKEGRNSYAFRLVFQSYKKTLTDGEVNEIMETLYSAVRERGWEVR